MNPRQKRNRLLAKVFTALPLLGRIWGRLARIEQESKIPWTPMRKPLSECRVCLITTGGLHLRTDQPFDMNDPEGDPTYRVIPARARAEDLIITHNYYDHRDADRDFNILLPLDRVRELKEAGQIAGVTRKHYSLATLTGATSLASSRKSCRSCWRICPARSRTSFFSRRLEGCAIGPWD